ncbi:MAG: hypothetical protein ACREV7_20040 [Steroidobacteraceae bacterium]
MTDNAEQIGHGGHPHKITIIVDGTKHEVRPGPWVVSQLKAAVGVPPAKVLAEITPQGLKDLEDTATITVHEGERFMSHVRTGGSS